MIQRPNDLVEIPPVWRTVIYYLTAEAIIVSLAVEPWLSSGQSVWALVQSIAQGQAILFFGTAAAKVTAKRAKGPVETEATLEPLPSETQRTGYGSGV